MNFPATMNIHAIMSAAPLMHPVGRLNPNEPMSPPPFPNTSQSARRHRNRAADWEQHKQSIKQLYIVEDHSFEDTMMTMVERHGFRAR